MANKQSNDTTGSLGFEAKMWEAADLLRSNTLLEQAEQVCREWGQAA